MPCAVCRKGGRRRSHAVARQVNISRTRVELRAAERHERIVLELDLRAEQRDFQHGLIRTISHQRVRQPERNAVHRAAGNDSEVLQPPASGILDRRQQSGLRDAQAHLRRA